MNANRNSFNSDIKNKIHHIQSLARPQSSVHFKNYYDPKLKTPNNTELFNKVDIKKMILNNQKDFLSADPGFHDSKKICFDLPISNENINNIKVIYT